jgi:tetratricopeptide (TPR) repeat protein
MTGRVEAFQESMNQGHSAAWEQDWERAASFYRQALEINPDNLSALVNLGLALFELQEYEESLRYYLKAVKASPEDPVPVEKVARLYDRLGNTERAQQVALHAAELYLKNRDVKKAIENWNRTLRINPENLQAHSRLAMVHEHLGNKPQAVHQYLIVASLYQHANDMEKAVRAVNRALQIEPNSPEARQALTMLRDFKPLPMPDRPRGGTGPLAVAQVHPLDAGVEGTREEMLDPIAEARQKALTVLASMLFDMADDDQAEQVSRRGLQSIVRGTGSLRPQKQLDRTRIMLHLSQVVELQSHNELSKAGDELERAMNAGLDHPAAYFDLGLMRAQSNRLDSAIRYLQYAVSHPDYALGARLLLGQALQSIGRVKDAAIEYLEALKLADSEMVPAERVDDLRQLYEPLIEAQSQETDAERLGQLCENVANLLLRPDWRAHIRRARLQLPVQANGGPPIPLAEVLLQTRSSRVVESLSKVFELEREGLLRSAMEESFRALEFAPTYLPLHAYMGELLLKQAQVQDAIAKFVVVALTYSARGEPRRAIDLYRRIIQLAPMDLNSRSRLIDQLVALDKVDEALKEYLDFAEVYYSQADLDMARKTYNEALKLSQQSNSDRIWRVKILHRLADIDQQSLDWRQALRILDQIRTLQPDDTKARMGLVELNFKLGQETQAMVELDNYLSYLISSGRIEAAIQFVEAVVNENPKRPHVRRRLAELYRKTGRTADAISQLDAAGEALLDAGDRTGALQVIETIVSMNPANAAAYQELLVQLRRERESKTG